MSIDYKGKTRRTKTHGGLLASGLGSLSSKLLTRGLACKGDQDIAAQCISETYHQWTCERFAIV